MDILYNSEGVPLMMSSDTAFYDTKVDRTASDERRRVLSLTTTHVTTTSS